jgi:hypothetical protein
MHLAEPRIRLFGSLAALAAAVAISLSASAPAPAAASTECQHPVGTGVEVSRLSHITNAAACPVALALYRWENSGNNGAKLYRCTGTPAFKPVLKLHSFEGWTLSIARSGYFEMSRGHRSFAVSGTDFPLACN